MKSRTRRATIDSYYLRDPWGFTYSVSKENARRWLATWRIAKITARQVIFHSDGGRYILFAKGAKGQ